MNYLSVVDYNALKTQGKKFNYLHFNLFFIWDVIMTDKSTEFQAILKPFKLGLKISKAAYRIQEGERIETMTDCTSQNWFQDFKM